MDYTAALNAVDLFASLNKQEIQVIANIGLAKHYPRQTILINEGELTDTLFIVLKGSVKVYASDDDGREVFLGFQGVGDYFGEMSILDHAPRSASVITLEPSWLLLIQRHDFLECLNQYPGIAVKLLQGMARRVRELTDKVKNLALRDVYGRVAHTLTQLATEADADGRIPQKLTQQNIADMVGASREMISRIMKELTIGGYIDIQEKHVTILKPLPWRW